MSGSIPFLQACQLTITAPEQETTEPLIFIIMLVVNC